MTDTPPTDREAATDAKERKAALIMRRRELVARLHARGQTQREIVAALAGQGIVNEDTKKPFDLAQINRDIKLIHAELIKRLQENAVARQARVYNKVVEAQRMAWAQEDTRAVFIGIKAEADLLGVTAAVKVDVTATWKDAAKADGLTPEQIAQAEAQAREAARAIVAAVSGERGKGDAGEEGGSDL